MSEHSNNDENMGIDERARSRTPHDTISADLFPMVIRDGVIELNRQQVTAIVSTRPKLCKPWWLAIINEPKPTMVVSASTSTATAVPGDMR